MIVSRLFGGAGNQLFQYAAGRALADHLGTELVLDRRYARAAEKNRADCFEHFTKARFSDSTTLPPSKMDGRFRYGLWRLTRRNPRFHREKGLGFDPDFFSLPDNTYLHGYWQSEAYFAKIAETLRRDLEMTTPLDPANQEMADLIAQREGSVAVHVRRGDYLALSNHAACPPDYYRNAIAHLQENTDTALTCFIFSNDPDWARENLDLGVESHVVALNDEQHGHFDMHLQSLCRHNIIANSTFSWWGAWLNSHPGKQVIAPARWFAPGERDNPDICPASWTRL